MLSSKRIVDSTDTDEDGADDDVETIISSPNVSGVGNLSGSMLTTECTTSATEWMVITTNSEDCSYSSELDHSDSQYSEDGGEHDFTPTVILNPCCGNSDRSECLTHILNVLLKIKWMYFFVNSKLHNLGTTTDEKSRTLRTRHINVDH